MIGDDRKTKSLLQIWILRKKNIIERHFEDISEKEVGLKLSQKEFNERDLKKSYWLIRGSCPKMSFERGLASSQFYISQLKRWCFKSISRISSVRNELESWSELFIHITGWSDSEKKILDGDKMYYVLYYVMYYAFYYVICKRYLQNKMAADSRELINRKFDSCQVNLRRSFPCTTVIPIYLNMTFESHRRQTFLALTICRNDLPK